MSLQAIMDAARRHGADSEPDHEVGDLHDALALAWERLTPAQQQEVFAEYRRDHEGPWDDGQAGD